MKIGLKDLPIYEDFSSCEDFWLIVCKAKSISSELDRDSIQFCTCEERSTSSSSITVSYQDLIGFVEKMAEAKSFVGFCEFEIMEI